MRRMTHEDDRVNRSDRYDKAEKPRCNRPHINNQWSKLSLNLELRTKCASFGNARGEDPVVAPIARFHLWEARFLHSDDVVAPLVEFIPREQCST